MSGLPSFAKLKLWRKGKDAKVFDEPEKDLAPDDQPVSSSGSTKKKRSSSTRTDMRSFLGGKTLHFVDKPPEPLELDGPIDFPPRRMSLALDGDGLQYLKRRAEMRLEELSRPDDGKVEDVVSSSWQQELQSGSQKLQQVKEGDGAG